MDTQWRCRVQCGRRADQPHSGGNTFNGVFLATFANESMQGDNLSQELTDRGLREPNKINVNYEWNPGFGGPIIRDKLWFYVAGMRRRSSIYPARLSKDTNYEQPRRLDMQAFERARHQRADAGRHPRPRDVAGEPTEQIRLYHARRQAVLLPAGRQSRELPRRRGSPRVSASTDQSTGEWTTPLTDRVLLEFGGEYIQAVSDVFPYEGTRPR